MAMMLSIVAAASALVGSVQSPDASAPQVPDSIAATIAGHIEELANPDRALDACTRLVAMGPLAVPALTAVVAEYQGGVKDRRVVLSVYCLGALGQRATSAVPKLLRAVDVAGSIAGYGGPESQFYWALAHIGPFHSDRPAISKRLAEAPRGWRVATDRAIALARIELGPRPHAATLRSALSDVTPEAVAALYALNQGAVAGF